MKIIKDKENGYIIDWEDKDTWVLRRIFYDIDEKEFLLDNNVAKNGYEYSVKDLEKALPIMKELNNQLKEE